MFATRFNPVKSPSVRYVEPSRTDQAQKKDCDINVIVERFRETGSLVDPLHPATRQPMFGDFTDIPDYQGAIAIIEKADAAFMNLPAKVRAKFGNNPQEIFDFLKDEKNRQEAIELGLIESSPSSQSETPASVDVKDDKKES